MKKPLITMTTRLLIIRAVADVFWISLTGLLILSLVQN